jgi:hypothetical protein
MVATEDGEALIKGAGAGRLGGCQNRGGWQRRGVRHPGRAPSYAYSECGVSAGRRRPSICGSCFGCDSAVMLAVALPVSTGLWRCQNLWQREGRLPARTVARTSGRRRSFKVPARRIVRRCWSQRVPAGIIFLLADSGRSRNRGRILQTGKLGPRPQPLVDFLRGTLPWGILL